MAEKPCLYVFSILCCLLFLFSGKTVSAEETDNDLKRQMTVSASDFVNDYYSFAFKGKVGSVDETGKNYINLCNTNF